MVAKPVIQIPKSIVLSQGEQVVKGLVNGVGRTATDLLNLAINKLQNSGFEPTIVNHSSNKLKFSA